MGIEQTETHVYRHRDSRVAFVSINGDGTARVGWPVMRKGKGLSDLAAHQRGEPIHLMMERTLESWDPASPPMEMEPIGTNDGRTLRINGNMSMTLRDYFCLPWPWRARGPDVELTRTDDGNVALFQRYPDGHAGTALRLDPTEKKNGSGAQLMTRVQEGEVIGGEETEAPAGAECLIARLQGQELSLQLEGMSEAESRLMGTLNECRPSAEETIVATIRIAQSADGCARLIIEGQPGEQALERAGARLLSTFRQNPTTELDHWLADQDMRLDVMVNQSGGARVVIDPPAEHKKDDKDGMLRSTSASGETVADAKRALAAQISGGILLTHLTSAGGRRRIAVPDFKASDGFTGD